MPLLLFLFPSTSCINLALSFPTFSAGLTICLFNPPPLKRELEIIPKFTPLLPRIIKSQHPVIGWISSFFRPITRTCGRVRWGNGGFALPPLRAVLPFFPSARFDPGNIQADFRETDFLASFFFREGSALALLPLLFPPSQRDKAQLASGVDTSSILPFSLPSFFN